MSFEHYPYEPCKVTWDSLYDEPRLVTHIMQAWRDDGLSASVPLLATEVNIAWQSNETFVDLFGGLWLADYTGAFLTAGGQASYYFHYFPRRLSSSCDPTWGGFTMFKADARYRVQQPLSQYFATQLLTQEWVKPGNDLHRVLPVSSEVRDTAGRIAVTAYAVARPDGQWSLLLINKDPRDARKERIAFRNSDTQEESSFSGSVSLATFGAENYVWHPNGADGYADPDGPIARSTQAAGADGEFTLPRASATVLRGAVK
jgi:hypothetical protein